MTNRIILLSLVFLIFPVFAGEDEPHGELGQTATFIFKEDNIVVQRKILEKIKFLAGDSVGNSIEFKKYNSKFKNTSWMASNVSKLEIFEIAQFWIPPNRSDEANSSGGKQITPIMSRIQILTGHLKNSSTGTAVQLSRELKYNSKLHIPYTEIPLWRESFSKWGSYASDRAWLKALAPEKVQLESNELIYSDEVIKALSTLDEK